jgi:murein DD-endopeptidase MepM/ murein hydrolase activator NlpD
MPQVATSVTIASSVGRDGTNRAEDVEKIRQLLNLNRHLLTPLPELPSTINQAGLIKAIEMFQRRVVCFSRPDGKVDPGGKTLKTLNANANPQKAARAVTMQFPFKVEPTQDFRTGGRQFGAPRQNGRLHAGCDLFQAPGTEIYAVDDGRVIQDPYKFYDGTYALEIDHGSFVVRYGEIDPAIVPGIKANAEVIKGQLIAKVGKLQRLGLSMLHFEMYSSSSSGELTVGENESFKRRTDLMDPTDFLSNAETIQIPIRQDGTSGRHGIPPFPGELRHGDISNAVKRLQLRLNERKYSCGSADSIFGNNTQKAVMCLQKDCDLPNSGLVDALTWEALFDTDEHANPANCPPTPGGTATIPFAVQYGNMPTRGRYPKGGPEGMVVHFTAGRPGKGCIDYGTGQGYAYLLLDVDGTLYQAHKLTHWGYHAGPSSWPGLGSGVSQRLVGVEIVSAGKCEKIMVNGEPRFKAWFHRNESEYFTADQMRYSEAKDNVEKGWYQKYTPAQEKALIQLARWLKQNWSTFSYDYVLGHDEVAPGRKSDPGGALSMTMPEFRRMLKDG